MQFNFSDYFGQLLLVIGIIVFATIVISLYFKAGKKKMDAQPDVATGGMTETSFRIQGKKLIAGRVDSFALVSMKIENLTQVYSSFGAEDGEIALRRIYEATKSQLSSGELIARTGEDTFCFFMKNRKTDEICARLDRVCNAINESEKQHKDGYVLRHTFGIYLPERNEEDIKIMQNRALIARLTEQDGKSYHFYDPRQREKNGWVKEVALSIDSALHTSEFVVFYQPKVRILDQKVVGAEALVRWRHHQRGMLSPDMFLPWAEKYQKIVNIDRFVFEEVCRTLHRWKKQDRELCPVSVNISGADMDHPDFPEFCYDTCCRYGVEPSLIEVEFKEDDLLVDTEKAKTVFERFHSLGFHCAIDNFGANYTSLQILGTLDVDTIKLDSSFFDGDNNNRCGRFITEAILKLATQLHIRTIATGVDGPGQVKYLQQMGCDVIQGFYYFKPTSLEKFETDAYSRNLLKFVEAKGERLEEQISIRARQATQGSKSIVLFSYKPDEDTIEFSDDFSPVLGNRKEFDNALALFRTTNLIHENDREDFFRLLERCGREARWVENTLRFYLAEGRYGWLELRLRQENSGSGRLICGTMINVSEWKNEVNRWKEKASRDALTGLYNREHFEKNVYSMLEHKTFESAAVIFIDVDDFKQVNDSMGHMFGDDVLCYVAKRILGVFRHTDIIARYGGDEFVVFAPSIQPSILEDRLKRLCDAFTFPYRNDKLEYKVSVTIGAAMYPEDGSEYDTLVEHADCALYEAKRRGKKQFVLFAPYMKGDKAAE